MKVYSPGGCGRCPVRVRPALTVTAEELGIALTACERVRPNDSGGMAAVNETHGRRTAWPGSTVSDGTSKGRAMSKGFDGSFPVDLTDEAVAIYRQAVRDGGFAVASISDRMQLPKETCRERIDELLTLGLVTKAASGDTIVPVNPRIAAAEITDRIEAEIRQKHEDIARINAITVRLLMRYESGRGFWDEIQGVDGLPAVRLALEAAANQCDRDVVCAVSDAVRQPLGLEESLPRDLDMLSRNVSMRLLCQTAMRYNRHTVGYVKAVSQRGARVRTLDEFFKSLIIFDRKVAFIPCADNENSSIVIRHPSIVGFLYDLFNRSWTVASPFETGSQVDTDIADSLAHPLTRRIILLLTDGEKDEAIARRLGISVRTCRKHIASLMSELGADSRFQAGYLSRTAVSR